MSRPVVARVGVAGAALGAIGALGIGAAGWLTSSRIRDRALRPAGQGFPGVLVREAGPERVSLEGETGLPPDLAMGLTLGLITPGGYARLESAPPPGGDRRLGRVWGAPPLPGVRGTIDLCALPPDPGLALGLGWQEVLLDGDVGALPTWEIPGVGNTWVIMLHGLGSTRAECLRALETVARAGHPALVGTYRNSIEGPQADGLARHGLAEWRDVEVMVGHALDQGADGVVLAGWSMGAALIGGFLRRSSLSPNVRGVFLDSPLLSLADAVDQGVARDLRGLHAGGSRLVGRAGRAVAARRFDVSFGDLELVDTFVSLPAPLGIVHGAADRLVPIGQSDAVAARRELAAYLRPAGVGHVRGWNADPPAYERALHALLTAAAGPDRISSGP